MKYLAIAATLVVLASCTTQRNLTHADLPPLVTTPNTTAQTNYGAQNGGYGTGVETTVLPNAGTNDASYFNSTIGNTVLFPQDQANLTATAMGILDAQARWLVDNGRTVQIEGHADEQGTREYNLALGARRAAAVRDYLVQKGVAYTNTSVITYGKERPLEVCSVESCWAKNRRAVTVVK